FLALVWGLGSLLATHHLPLASSVFAFAAPFRASCRACTTTFACRRWDFGFRLANPVSRWSRRPAPRLRDLGRRVGSSTTTSGESTRPPQTRPLAGARKTITACRRWDSGFRLANFAIRRTPVDHQ